MNEVEKISKSDYQLRHVHIPARPSVRIERLGSIWTDFHEIQYLFIFWELSRSFNDFFFSLQNDAWHIEIAALDSFCIGWPFFFRPFKL